jgi:hypothetical protein
VLLHLELVVEGEPDALVAADQVGHALGAADDGPAHLVGVADRPLGVAYQRVGQAERLAEAVIGRLVVARDADDFAS